MRCLQYDQDRNPVRPSGPCVRFRDCNFPNGSKGLPSIQVQQGGQQIKLAPILLQMMLRLSFVEIIHPIGVVFLPGRVGVDMLPFNVSR